ncbi:efflux RND transporter periplasmic adaptor subunit [Pseudomonas nicosulfuronedens]
MSVMHGVLKVIRALVTAAAVAAAALAVWYVWSYYERDPRTRNGHVRADIVQVSTDISGLVTEVFVENDQRVAKGQLLFQVDTQRFELAREHARAALTSAEASLRFAEQVQRRNHALKGLVAEQAVQQADSDELEARSRVELAKVALKTAELDLERSSVRAPVNGIITYADLRPGAYVQAGRGMLALVDLDSLRVEGYFQENRLHHVHLGDRAEVSLMGDERQLYGTVVSITAAINDSDTKIAGNLLPSISPNFDWVRLAQRIPVRIKLDPQYLSDELVSGRSASVLILGPPGAATQPGEVKP